MKKFKKGFSLAELLIAIGIVSVIAVFGTTIAKKNIERAFDLYVYTGFKGLQDGIAYSYANNNGFGGNSEPNNEALVNILTAVFGGKADKDTQGPFYVVTAKNNIKYTLPFYQNDNDRIDDTENYSYRIKMEIPYVKTQDSDKAQICLRYLDSPNSSFDLYPVESFAGNSSNDSCTTTKEVFGNIQDRIDLLPFYIDDGTAGRLIQGKYTPKEFYSFREAACKSKNDIDLSHKNISIDCRGIDGLNPKIGMLRVQNPRKAF